MGSIKYILCGILTIIILLSIYPHASENNFILSESVINQAKETAAKESNQDSSEQRPEGLEQLDIEDNLKEIIEESIKELASDDSGISTKAFSRLKYIGKYAFDDLIKALESENPDIRKNCVSLLGYRGTKAVAYLSKIVRTDPIGFVRSAAASELGQIFDPDAVPALIDSLEDEDLQVKMRAIRALGYLRDNRAFEPLKKILEDTQVNSPIRHAAGESLFRIDKEHGRETLEAFLEGKVNDSLRHNLNVVLNSTGELGYWPPDLLDIRELTWDASTIAGETFTDKQVDLLIENLGSDYGSVSVGCLVALTSINARDKVPEIIEKANKSITFYSTLSQLAAEQAADCIIESVQSPDKDIQRMSVYGLRDGDRWAIPILVELLDNPILRTTHEIQPPIDAFNGKWPDTHKAYDSLNFCLRKAGLKGTDINLASGKGSDFDIDKEILRIKKWWEQYGNDFLSGKSVPNPNLISLYILT